MSERTRKIMRNATEFLKERKEVNYVSESITKELSGNTGGLSKVHQVSTFKNGVLLKTPEDGIVNQQPPNSQNELAIETPKEDATENPQPSTIVQNILVKPIMNVLGDQNNGSTETIHLLPLKHDLVIEQQIEDPNISPQPSTSKSHLVPPTKQVAELSKWVVNKSNCTKVSLRKVGPCKYFPSPGSDSDKLFSSGSSDNYEPDSSDESSSDELCTPLVHHNDTAINNINETENLNETKKGKKRIRNEHNWDKVKRKKLKNLGNSYISKKGKIVEARKMGPPCRDKCVQSCTKKLTDNFRSQLFKLYWELGSLQRQRDFLISCVEPLVLKYRRITATEPRKTNCAFYVQNNNEKVRVCKTFLINTLGITERTIRTVIQAKVTGPGIAPVDRRGKHDKHKKIPEEVMNSVRNHINSIPRIESHYVRKETSREFIDGGLTVAEMHRHYTSERSADRPVANYDTYARIFNTEFNIGFFCPKKDQCDQCEGYNNAVGEDKNKLEESFKEHQKEKELSRIEKTADKEMAKNDEIVLAVYDLQAVLPVPMGQSSAFFYKSRLNCFNFTVTDIVNDRSVCYFWHEGLGHRGVNEIATGVYKFIEELAKQKPGLDIVFYSDNCGGQQKNKYIISMYLFAVQNHQVNSITHKYLIRGHTQNEGDAIHSTIESALKRAKRSGPVYVPDQYISLIRNAKKKGNPLDVKELGFEDFIDFKALHDEMAPNTSKDSSGNVFKLSGVKQLKFEKGSDKFLYKNSYEHTSWKEVPFKPRQKRSCSRNSDTTIISLKPAYTKRISLSENKLRDLKSLCEKNIIPHYYTHFYQSLC